LANGSSGITHVSAAELARWLRDPASAISAEHLDARDGLPGFSAERIPEPSIAESREGRLWFATTKGIAWLDPAKLQENRNRLPPPVMISKIFSNGKTYLSSKDLTLPAHTEKLEIDYTALSLAIPERVLFRYMLDGLDKEWQDAGTRRQAFYTGLPPGRFRFHVIACNNDGVWNEDGAVLDFSIAPAFYQTGWFLALCAVSAMALLYTLYMLRVRQLARQFEVRMEERVGERTRIARELHDTLLQTFQAVLLKFHALTYQLPDRPEVRKILDTVIDQASQAVTEGRDAVQRLRSSTVVTNDLARAIRTLGAELVAAQSSNSPDFLVSVEGTPRDLAPILRDDVYRIACEAVRNAIQHAQAGRIEVLIRYDRRQLQLRIRDDGKGIDPKVLEAGARTGHYGLPGLYERAKIVGGRLTFRSQPGSGTEIELTVQASVAYSASARRAIFLGKRAS
jgi:signal transduction histidine kinase